MRTRVPSVNYFIRAAGKKGERRRKRTVSALKRWTRTRSRRGTRDLMDLNVAWAAEALFYLITKVRDQ